MSEMSKKQSIQIVGGGFSGLMQAFYLAEAGVPVQIFETEDRVGGLLGSRMESGFLIEQAANAFIANQELERVSSVIGVPLIEKMPAAKKRYILNNGKMSRWPLGFIDSLRLAWFGVKWIFAKKLCWPRPQETLREWGDRFLGQTITRQLIETGLQGVYAISGEYLSADLILESFNTKPALGSLRGSVSPRHGMQEWVDGLVRYLESKDVKFHLNASWTDHDPQKPTIYCMGLKGLKAHHKQIPGLPASLQDTQVVSLTSVCVAFKNSQFQPEGFGCLFPEKEKFKSLGVLFNHSIFAGRVTDGTSETWIYNDQKEKVSELDPKDVLKKVLVDRHKLTGEIIEPDLVSVHPWSQRIPLYNDKLKKFIEDLRDQQETQKPPYLINGNFLGHLGLAKIPIWAQKNRDLILGGYFG